MRGALCLGMTAAFTLLGGRLVEPVAHAEEARSQDDRNTLFLIDQLRDADEWTTRMEAAVLLGRSGDIRARKPLMRALEDTHYAVRAATIRALSKLRDPRAIKPLLDRIGDDEPYVRTEARRALAQFDLEDAHPYLLHALRRHPDPQVRLAAAERLAESDDPTTRAAMLDATGDDSDVGRFAVSVLRALPQEE